jgi:hypothetical protein
MKTLFVILGIIAGIIIAWILNRLLAGKIEDKGRRIGLKITSYIVCIILALGFVSIGSLRITLVNFVENRMETVEILISKIPPELNIPEITIDTNKFVSMSDEVEQIIKGLETYNDTFIEKLIYNAFLKKYFKYVYAVKNGMDTIAAMSDDNGMVTINSILYYLKGLWLNTISKYCLYGQTGILFLLLVYIGILVFLTKGGTMYNKAIVFGDINYDNSSEKQKNRE